MPLVTIYEDVSKDLKIEGNVTFPSLAPRCTASEHSFGCHGIMVNNVCSPQYSKEWSWEHYGIGDIGAYFKRNKLIPTGDFSKHFKTVAELHAAINAWYIANYKSPDAANAYVKSALDRSIDYYSGYSIVVFAPVMNYQKASRGVSDSSNYDIDKGGYATWALIKRIAERKIGHLCGSPVTVNRVHSGPVGNNLSYTQGFVWIPNPGTSTIMGTTFSRMLNKSLKLTTEKDEAAIRKGEEGKLFQNIKKIIEENS